MDRSTLHTVNKASAELLQTCLRILLPGDSVLLIEDGVYLVSRTDNTLAQLQASGARLFVLEEDLQARGIPLHSSAVTLSTYDDFVRLCTEHDKTISWF